MLTENAASGKSSWDAVVIGSGLGGLGVAALLAEEKKWKVLVLEAHSQAGGFTHTFSRKGWEWDTGLHYVGGVHYQGSMLRKLFDRVTKGRLGWSSTGEIVDRFLIDGQEFVYPAGRAAWRARMLEYFPSESTAIDNYLKLVDKVVRSALRYFSEKAMPSFPAMVFGSLLRRSFLKYSRKTLGEVLKKLSPDPSFRAVLSGQYGDHGLSPSRASFAIHAMVFAHYLGGAGYPIGGSGAIAPAIIPTIEAAGGKVLLRSRVDEILIDRGRAVGVRTANGEEFQSRVIISDVGLPNTVEMLPDDTPGREKLEDIVGKIGVSAAHCCLHLGLDATAEELQLPKANLWIFPSSDLDGAVDAFADDPEAEFPLLFISFPSAKDSDFERKHPNKATIEITLPAGWEQFSRWQGDPPGKKGEEYKELKAKLSRRLLDILQRQFPQVEGHIAIADLSTPLTTRFFCGYRRGEIYGLAHSPERFEMRDLKPRTPVPGLWLSGQDVCTAGIIGALLGATLCASAITGRNLMPR